MNILDFNLQKYAKHKYLRIDIKYWNTAENNEFDSYIKVKDIFNIITGTTQTQSNTIL